MCVTCMYNYIYVNTKTHTNTHHPQRTVTLKYYPINEKIFNKKLKYFYRLIELRCDKENQQKHYHHCWKIQKLGYNYSS